MTGQPIAALFVETGGSYFNLPGVDPWDEVRDARKYSGPSPVVAHPPCQRWGKFWAGQPLWIARTGEREVRPRVAAPWMLQHAAEGPDAGERRREAPAVVAFHFALAVPPRAGGWVKADELGGWTCYVEQGRYGHYARKPTLLYTVGAIRPELLWGQSAPTFPAWAVEKYGLAKCKRAGELAFKGGGKDNTPRIGTPPEFRAILLSMAATARRAAP